MKAKAKAVITSVFNGIGLFFKYLSAIIGPSIGNAGILIICSLATFAFYYETATPLLESRYYFLVLNGFYVFVIAAGVGSIIAATYKTGKKHLLSPANKAEKFRYFNGFFIGLITAAPFIALCIVAGVRGATYYSTEDNVVSLIKMFSYVYLLLFDSHPAAADFSYLKIMVLALLPIAVCTLSYIAPKAIKEIKENRQRKKEAA